MGELLRLDGKANHSEFVINIRAMVGSSLWNEFCEKSLRDFADAGKPSTTDPRVALPASIGASLADSAMAYQTAKFKTKYQKDASFFRRSYCNFLEGVEKINADLLSLEEASDSTSSQQPGETAAKKKKQKELSQLNDALTNLPKQMLKKCQDEEPLDFEQILQGNDQDAKHAAEAFLNQFDNQVRGAREHKSDKPCRDDFQSADKLVDYVMDMSPNCIVNKAWLTFVSYYNLALEERDCVAQTLYNRILQCVDEKLRKDVVRPTTGQRTQGRVYPVAMPEPCFRSRRQLAAKSRRH